MTLYRNAYLWFGAVFLILIVGFWNSYFSKLGAAHWTHHFHAVAMIVWMLLLITQAWLIRNRKNTRHRALGKLSFIIAPAVVLSAIAVTQHSQTQAKDPLDPETLGVFFLGYFSAALFALLYVQAIRHRRTMQLHARYMALTALLFLMPGLVRAVYNYIAPLGVWVPTFYQFFFVPLIIGLWLMSMDIRRGREWRPYLVSNLAWAFNQVMWVVVPFIPWWREYAAWVASGA